MITSRAENKAQLRATPLFLYHAGRTGGVAFSSAFYFAYKMMFLMNKVQNPPSAGRVELEHRDVVQKPHIFVGTHGPFGFHTEFNQQAFQLVALIRDPVPRISSIYTKACMRAGTPASHEGFLKFLDETKEHNGMVAQLCGLTPGSAVNMAHAAQARETLERQFASFCDTTESPKLINFFFSAFNLPNVLQQIPNRTLPEYKIDSAPFVDTIRARNTADVALFDWVRENPRIPATASESPQLSPLTILIYESEQHAKSLADAALFSTATVAAALRGNPALAGNMGTLHDTCLASVKQPAQT